MLLGAGALRAQTPIAPSQNGMFFDDLRKRASQVRQGNTATEQGQVTGTAGTYDYSGGQYTGEPGELGQMPVDPYGRPIGTPGGGGTQPVTFARRLTGDYTRYTDYSGGASSHFTPNYVSDPFLGNRRNIKLGPVNIGLGFTGAVEYDDNITRVPGDTFTTDVNGRKIPLPKLSDFKATSFLNLDANYPLSEHNRLTFTTSLGMSYYFDHPEVSSTGKHFEWTVLPGSSLALDLKAGNVVFVIYDRLSVRPATQDNYQLDNRYVFGVVQNDFGIAANWAINSELSLSLNVSRSDSRAQQETDKKFDRTINSISGSLAWSPSGTWTAGLEGSYSKFDYIEDFNNDGSSASGGVFVVLPISNNTVIRAAGGIQHFQFDPPPSFSRTVTDQTLTDTQNQIDSVTQQIAALNVNSTDAATQQANQTQLASLQAQQTQLNNQLATQTAQKAKEDTTFNSHTLDSSTDKDDYYYNVTISNQLSARVNHQLSFGHETTLNTTSNYVTADYISYGLGVIVWRGARLTVSGYYEESKQSGGHLKEDINQYGFDVQFTHQLSEHLAASVGYHYGNVDSSDPTRSYVQNAYNASLIYQLNTKWNVALGYNFWTTDAVDHTQDFDQNRITLSTNYNF